VARRERFERRAPVIGHAPLGEIARRFDGEIDSAIDNADASEAALRATQCHDLKEASRRLRTGRVLLTERQDLPIAGYWLPRRAT